MKLSLLLYIWVETKRGLRSRADYLAFPVDSTTLHSMFYWAHKNMRLLCSLSQLVWRGN